jgi:hypothetical protein
MTTATDIRAAIVAKVQAVAGIGKVHAYERFAVQQSKLKELYAFEDRILGWNVSRASFKKTMIGDGLFLVRSNWKVRGFMSLDDARETELLFDALADQLQAKLANDPTFNKLAAWVPDYELKAELEPVMFCGILCHSATITFDSMHEETTTIDGELDDFLHLNAQFDVELHASTAEHNKWLQEPSDYGTSNPDLTAEIYPQE